MLVWGPASAALTLLGALIFLPYAIGRTRQAEVAAGLKIKRALEVRSGRSS